MNRSIQTAQAPEPIGPYSQAIFQAPFLFLSGQVAINPVDQQALVGTIEQEAEQVMTNIRAILNETGMGFEHVVNTTIYLTNFDNFAAVNTIYEKYLSSPFPARTTVEVSRLPKNLNLEISIIAIKS